MTPELTRYRFESFAIKGAPEDPGVYVLWEGDELTYIRRTGGGETIRACLLDHLEQRRRCPCKPTHYSWVLARDVNVLERLMLLKHRQEFQRAPRCNASTG